MPFETMTFEQWKNAVSRLIHQHFHLTLDDLPDMMTRDAYDNEVSPQDFFDNDVMDVLREEFGDLIEALKNDP